MAEDQPHVSNQVHGSGYGTVVQAGNVEKLVLLAPSAAAPAPLSMRGDLPDFTGRVDDLHRLLAVISVAGPAPRAVAIHAVDGMPGVGKTAFCVHAAHELAARFPDGQIFLELHGHTPGQEPVAPERALNSLLIATGMDPKLISSNLDDQARLWRDRTTGRRMLILLDDAASLEQVRPLLPGTPDCLVLITSRHCLGGLAGVRPLTLTVLPPADGVAMLRRIAGRSDAGPGDDAVVGEIVTRWCGCLPLAIALVAARWRSHPTWDARYLAGLLADAHDHLEHLQTGDESVRAAFDMSLRQLPARSRRTFHLLGALVGPEFDAYALAALTDTALPQAREDLENLYNDHLVQETTPGRFRLHDLLRAYARSHAAQLDPTDRDSALDRVINYYLRATIAAAERLPTVRTSTLPPALIDPVRLPRLDTLAEARAWLATELPTLIAYLDHAAATDADRAIQLADALVPFLSLTRDVQQALHVYRTQHTAATIAGNPTAQANALNNLGRVQHFRGEYEAATSTLTQAHGIYTGLGNGYGQANTLVELGQVQYFRGEYEAATSTLTQAHSIYTDLGNRCGQANALNELGRIQYFRGELEAATGTFTQAHSIYTDLGDRLGQATTLAELGQVQRLRGEYEAAARTLTQAHSIYTELGDCHGQATALVDLGIVQHQRGEYEFAARTLTRAYTSYTELGDRLGQANTQNDRVHPRGEYAAAASDFLPGRDIYARLGQANALNNLGRVQYFCGEYEVADSILAQAHNIYTELGNRLGQANALNDLGRVQYFRGEYAAAARTHALAHDIYTDLGNRYGQAHALTNLGCVQHFCGEYAAATSTLSRARQLFTDVGDQDGLAEVLNNLGDLALVYGPAGDPNDYFGQALRIARETGVPGRAAAALHGLARLLLQQHDVTRALPLLTRARAICPTGNSAVAVAIEHTRTALRRSDDAPRR